MSRSHLALMLVTLTGLVPARSWANDSVMGGHGGNLVPLGEARVVMVSEDIELTYDEGDWHVRAHYLFRNETDEAVKLQMGFPETHCDGEGDCAMGEGESFRGMRTRVRGKEVPRKRGKVSKKHPWAPKLGVVWLYDVRFEPGETLAIDHEYTTPSGGDVMGNAFTTYVTRTGALWGKPIERATFRVVLPARTLQVHEPEAVPRARGERLGGDDGPLVLTYEAHNWTPQGDFHVGFNERVDWYGLEPAGPLKDLRCEGLFTLYLVAETDDGRNAMDTLEMPSDLPSLRLCRNAVYALHGRRFRDEALNQYFYGPEGFSPDGPALLAFDPDPSYSVTMLTAEDRKVLEMIREQERAVAAEQGVDVPLVDEPEEATAADLELAETEQGSTGAPPGSPAAAPTTAPGPEADGPKGGCGGCAAAPVSGAGGWLLPLWLLVRRRRDPRS